jgi:hypothetical protein
MSLAVVVVLGAWLAPQRSASADGCKPSDSVPIMCGGIGNETGHAVLAVQNWGDCGGDVYEHDEACPGSWNYKTLTTYQFTNDSEDWDAFLVDKGCKYEWSITPQILDWIKLELGFGSPTTFSLDRRNWSMGAWVRIHTDQTATITSVTCTNSGGGADDPPDHGGGGGSGPTPPDAPDPPSAPNQPPPPRRSSVAMLGNGVDNTSVDLLRASSQGFRFSPIANGRHAPGFGWSGMKVVTGDFNGDGRMDLAAIGAGVDGSSIDLLVALATSDGHYAPIANWRHAPGFGFNGIKIIAGDFNGDGKWDIGALGNGVNNTSVDLLVATSTGSSFNGLANWRHAEGYGWGGMKPIAGDFNGDGRWDFGAVGAGVNNTSIDLLVATSTGAGFNGIANWRHAEGYGWVGVKPVAGDFNGDGRWDFGAIGLGVNNTSIDLLIATSTGSGFNGLANWLHAEGYGWSGMKPVAGDFNGDGKWDIGAIGAGVDNASVDLLVAISGAGRFNAIANWLHAPGYGWSGLAPASL